MVYTNIYISLFRKMEIKQKATEFIWRKNAYILD